MTARSASRIAVAVAGGLVFTGLGRQNLWLDEVMSYEAVRGSWSNLQRFFVSLPEQHPLYYMLLRAWRVFGSSEFALRSLSAICIVLAIPLIAVLARELAGEAEGAVAAWLAATSPFLLYYGQEARMYALVVLLAAASGVALVRWLTAERRMWLVVYGLVTVAGCYTHFFFTFLVAAQFLAALVAMGWRRSAVRRLFVAQMLVAIAYAPWAVLLVTHFPKPQAWKGAANVVFGIPYTFLRFVVGYAVVPANFGWKQRGLELVMADSGVLAPAVLGFGLAGGYGIVRLWRAGGTARLPSILLLAPMALALMVSAVTIMIGERYFIVCFPFFVAVVAAGLVSLVRDQRSTLGWLAGAALVVVTGISIWRYYRSTDFGKEQWADAAALVRSSLSPGDVVAVHEGYALPSFAYYFKPAIGERLVPGDVMSADWTGARIWLVIAHATDEATYLDRFMVGRRVAVDRRFLHDTGIRVLRLDPEAPDGVTGRR
ncbi:MAG TPA: glycosyltransferase family 39 protein [Gemmatimonadaceae bacterium]|nr:glycosyltransferase family 39 protein [Gemmatimonadaceae bacterium]